MVSSVLNRASLFARRVLYSLTGIRFALLMSLLLIGVAVWSDTHTGPLHADLRRLFGFAPWHLPALYWHRLFTSAFFTAGGTTFYQSLAMLAGCVACCEWIAGTRRTVLVFWGVHLVTLGAILTPMAFAAASMGAAWAQLLVQAADVGPSAGYYGCLGVAVWYLPKGWRRSLATTLLAVLAVRLAFSMMTVPDHGRQIAADMAHLVAFPIGLLLGPWATCGPATGAKPSLRANAAEEEVSIG